MALLRKFFLLTSLFCLPNVFAGTAYTVTHSGVAYDIYQVPVSELSQLTIFWEDPAGVPYKKIRHLKTALEKDNKTLLFATNGGIYGANYRPLGLYIENGKRYYQLSKGKGGGNFFLQPNGVFYLTKQGAQVVNTTQYKPKSKVLMAVQSGPLLVENNQLHPKFISASKSKYVRNGVGVDGKGQVFFAISQRPINLYSFASLFRDKLKTPNALYLDGGISAMYAPTIGRQALFQWTRFVSIIALVAK